MDGKELEEKVLHLLVQHGGTIEQKVFLHEFSDVLKCENAEENKIRLKKAVGQYADVKRQGDSKLLILRNKYRLETGVPLDSPIHGLKQSIFQALSKSMDVDDDSRAKPGTRLSADDLLSLAEKEEPKRRASFDEGVSVVVVNKDDGPDAVSESMRRLSESSSLAKMLVPLPNTPIKEETEDAIDEVEIEPAGKIKHEVTGEEHIQEAPAVGDDPMKSPNVVHSSASEPDLTHLNKNSESTPLAPIQHSESDHGMIIPDSTIRPHSIQHKMSVKDRARLYEKEEQEKDVSENRPAAKSGSVSSMKSGKSSRLKGADNDSLVSDTHSMVSITLNEQERRWVAVSSSVDYQTMCKMLESFPELARHVNFLDGYTALHWAAKKGHSDAIKLLAGTYRADVNKATGYTPLHMAAMQDHIDAIDLLIQNYGADSNIRDAAGRLPKQYLNNAFNTRKLTLAEKRQMRPGAAPSRSSDSTRPAKPSSLLAQMNGGSSDCNGLGHTAAGFSRIGSIRRAGVAAFNLLRGQQANARMPNGQSSSEEANAHVGCKEE